MFSRTVMWGVQSVVLEHHGDIPVLGCHIVHQLAVDIQFAAADLLQAGDHPQGSGLAAAGGTYQHDELLVRNVQAELLHCQHALIRNLEVRLLLLRALFLLGGFLVGIDLLMFFRITSAMISGSGNSASAAVPSRPAGAGPASVAGLHTAAPRARRGSPPFSSRSRQNVECRSGRICRI